MNSDLIDLLSIFSEENVEDRIVDSRVVLHEFYMR